MPFKDLLCLVGLLMKGNVQTRFFLQIIYLPVGMCILQRTIERVSYVNGGVLYFNIITQERNEDGVCITYFERAIPSSEPFLEYM